MLLKSNSLIQIITNIFLFIVFTGCLATNETDAKVYIAVAVYFFISLFFFIFFNERIIITKTPCIISFIFLCIWLYGFILGIIKGNNRLSIYRNFAGMTLYFLVFAFSNKKLTVENYKKMISFFANYTLIITIFTYISLTYFNFQILFKIPVINAFVGGGGKNGFVQYFCRELIHVSFSYYLYIFLVRKTEIKNIIMIVLALYATIVVNDSGGDVLAQGMLTFIILIIQMKRGNKKSFLLFISIIIALLILRLFSGEWLLSKLFSSNDSGNIRRWEEINYFKESINFWGYGLGAYLDKAGSGQYNYGTEMIYLNIFHKFGFFAIFIILCYVKTCVNALKYLSNNPTNNPYKVIPLALMSYIIPSIANPMLFGVLAVISHLLAMIIISKDKNNYKKSWCL